MVSVMDATWRINFGWRDVFPDSHGGDDWWYTLVQPEKAGPTTARNGPGRNYRDGNNASPMEGVLEKMAKSTFDDRALIKAILVTRSILQGIIQACYVVNAGSNNVYYGWDRLDYEETCKIRVGAGVIRTSTDPRYLWYEIRAFLRHFQMLLVGGDGTDIDGNVIIFEAELLGSKPRNGAAERAYFVNWKVDAEYQRVSKDMYGAIDNEVWDNNEGGGQSTSGWWTIRERTRRGIMEEVPELSRRQ
ncbi:hypothetical protein Tco_0533731 [Tanacetum coccineum]